MSEFLYIGPGLGMGTIVVVLLISAMVVVSLGYVVWLRIKKYFKKNK